MHRHTTTYADVLRPTARWSALAYDTTLILGGSLVVALAAQIAVRLPFSPVPVTGQTLAVLLVGALLGSRRGAWSTLAYLGQGLIGLPVFATGSSGAAYVLGPTGGYLLGFVVAAYLTGWLAERGWDQRIGTALLAMGLGNVAIYALGLPWLSIYAGSQTLALGLLPYLAGDALKLALAAAALPGGWRLLRSR
jgi:biotin transport system substrate-specific component